MRGTLVRPVTADRTRLSLATGERAQLVARWAAVIALLGALVPIGVYIWIAAHRLDFPYELDWMEGGAVELVGRVVHGQSLYTSPTLAYVSYTYPPLYTWVSAALAEITGLGFLPLRLVSFGSSLIAIWTLWRWVFTATGDRIAGAVGAGLFAACYGLTGWWFDVGRLDSMYVALALLALWLGRGARGVRAGMGVGALAFLAFFTKQTALVVVVPALVWLALARPRAGLTALAVLGAAVAGSTLLMDALTNGWYRYYVVDELAGQAWQPREWGAFWRVDLYRHLRPLVWLLAVALAVSAVGAWHSRGELRDRLRGELRLRRSLPRPRGDRLSFGYELAAAAGLVLAAWFSRLHTGGYVNVLMPAYAGCALLGGLAFARLRALAPAATLLAVALVLLQLIGLMTLPNHALPAGAERRAGNELISRLRSLPGPVLVLDHPWYGTLAGKGSFAQSDAITEVLRSAAPRGRTDLTRALAGALDRYRIQAVVLDHAPRSWLAGQLAHQFVLESQPVTPLRLRPPADIRAWPEYLYVRRSAAAANRT